MSQPPPTFFYHANMTSSSIPMTIIADDPSVQRGEQDLGARLSAIPYSCRCGRPIFFRNTQCLNCGALLGYDPALDLLGALSGLDDQHGWQLLVDESLLRLNATAANLMANGYRRCHNAFSHASCNWLIAQSSPHTYCLSCRLNQTIPDLSLVDNQQAWKKTELAKRLLIRQLLSLQLPVQSRQDDPVTGLAFDFLKPVGGEPVLTGHEDGLITLNINEADDAYREKMRTQMGEPYRTLLGHLRHEIGHYYWDRLIDNTSWLEGYRQLFGDERMDYADALDSYYEQGPQANWQQAYVSSYATSHPWEDWAETWAHYLHIDATLKTARHFGFAHESLALEIEKFTVQDLYDPQHPDAEDFLRLLNASVSLTTVLNEFARSMGQSDHYPFVLTRTVIAKLHFIHMVIDAQAQQARISNQHSFYH